MSFCNKTRQSFKTFGEKWYGFSRTMTRVTIIPNPIGGHAFVRGNVVNIPVDIAHTVKLLPQNLNDTQTVSIKL